MMSLPTGRRGQALAVSLTLLVLALVWLGAVSPAIDWYQGRAESLTQQQTLADHMEAIAATAPALQRQVAQADTAPPPARMLLGGATDAIAGAQLQQAVQDMAVKAGATVTSAEVLPAETVGSYRRIGLRVTVTGGWPVLVALFTALSQATPRMLVDDLSLHPSPAASNGESHPLEATFTVLAYRAGATEPPSAPGRAPG